MTANMKKNSNVYSAAILYSAVTNIEKIVTGHFPAQMPDKINPGNDRSKELHIEK
jgi:hypothetical protein